jgi:type 1 fimbriae regulatory protein FimE
MNAVASPSQASFSAKRTPPTRRENIATRSREYLTPLEIDRMISAVCNTGGRLAVRDKLLILLAYRHGLRAIELTELRWEQVELETATLHVARHKKGSPSTHPLRGPEIRQLRAWRRLQEAGAAFVFTSLRGGPMTVRTVHYVVALAGREAGIAFPVHPHMLRHATGYYLANAGHDTRAIQHYLGHRNIQHTVRYTELAADRFKNFWKD